MSLKGLDEIKEEIKEAHKKEVKRMKAEIIACLVSIVKRSAVDTGRYRSNWQLSLNKRVDTEKEDVISQSAVITDLLQTVSKAPRGDVVYYFQNNVSYAETIEYEYNRYAGRVRADVDKLKRAVS